jgi:putative transposase
LYASTEKEILVGQLHYDVKRIFLSIALDSDFDIEVMETDRDHIHLLIRYIPGWSISQIARRLKQESTRQIWLLHPTLLAKAVLVSACPVVGWLFCLFDWRSIT